MKKSLPALAIFIASLLIPAAARGEARGLNKELYAVPAPEKVVIDASLDEWDISGMVLSYVIPETAETQSARIAMMYDDDALYIGGIVRDSSPMMNRHDPKTNPSRAWDADVCQIFFSLNPDDKLPLPYSSFNKDDVAAPVATMLLWYYTDDKEPSLAMYRGMKFVTALRPDLDKSGVIPEKNFDAAYRKGDDGLSYTFEYRIPWTTFAMKRRPAADDHLAAALAVFWGRPDGLKTAGGKAWAWNVMGTSGFAFQSADCWGKLIFSPTGNIPEELVSGGQAPERPLPLTFTYKLPREGEATIQLFDANNRAVRILVAQQRRPEGVNTERWDGLDDHGEPLPAGTYRWRGVVHDPIKAEYRFSVHNSGQPPYPTDDNRGGWGGDHGTPQAVLALKDGMILSWNVCEYGWGVIRVDLDGRKLWGSKYNAEYLATDGKRLFVAGGHSFSGAEGVSVLDLADSRPLNFQPGMPTILPPPQKSAGESEEADTVTGLACDGKRLYVAYRERNIIAVHDLNGNLVEQWSLSAPERIAVRPEGSLAVVCGESLLGVQEGAVSTVIAGGLDQPRGVAVSPQGEIFVALAGNTQQVKVFNAQGEFLRTIGKADGRPAKGAYDSSGIYQPGGIAIDARGRLWVAETTDGPKRISVWDAKTGANLKEFFGGSGYFGYGFIDPARPDEIYAHYVIWKIDWQHNQATPATTFWRKTSPNMMESVSPSGYNHGQPLRVVTATNGVQYMWGQTMRSKTVLQRREGDLFKPFAAMIQVSRGGTFYNGLNIPLIDDDPEAFPNGRYFWQDANNDQIVQADEIVGLPREFSNAWFVWLDEDLSLYLTSGHVVRPRSITEQNQPIYDFADAKPAAIGHYGWCDDQGNCYTYSRGTMIKRSPDGQPFWSYSGIVQWHDALGMPIVGPGRLHGMTGPMGVAGDYFGMMSYFGVNHIFTRDGIYVAALLHDGRLGGRGAEEGQPEGQGGDFVKLETQPDGPDRYFIIHGGQDTRIWEVLGMNSVQRLNGGSYVHTAEAVATARKTLEDWKAAKAGNGKLIVVRGRDALDDAEPVGKTVDGNRSFQARLARDNANLYVRYDVTAPYPLVNSIAEDQLVFRGGNCLDLQIATDPNADPKRKKPAPGDVRVLVTRKAGKPFAMIYRPKVAGFSGQPTVFESPTGDESFDAIEQSDRIRLDYEHADTGFTAVVTIPLDVLGWNPKSGSSVRMDIGYIFGNNSGTRAAARAYWHNNGFSANVVNDIPNESRLEPAEWGRAVVE